MEGDSGIVMEDVCGNDMWNLGGRLVLMLMRTGILVGGVISAKKLSIDVSKSYINNIQSNEVTNEAVYRR